MPRSAKKQEGFYAGCEWPPLDKAIGVNMLDMAN
jgi:hypothetical protein